MNFSFWLFHFRQTTKHLVQLTDLKYIEGGTVYEDASVKLLLLLLCFGNPAMLVCLSDQFWVHGNLQCLHWTEYLLTQTNTVSCILSSPFLISSINFKHICVVFILSWRLSAQNIDHCNKPVIYLMLVLGCFFFPQENQKAECYLLNQFGAWKK